MYEHMALSDLTALRDRLIASLHARLTGPSMAESTGRRVQYQQSVDQIRREIEAVNAEITRRAGRVTRVPIYMVG